MITLIKLQYPEQVRNLLRVDMLYKDLLEGFDIDRHTIDMGTVAWFEVEENEEPVGIFFLKELTSNTVIVNAGLFRKFRNKRSSEMLKEAIQIIKKVKSYRFISTVNKNNIASQKATERAGFKQIATIPGGFDSGDLIMYGEI
jgi:RimJ/RimL family protein N-acetyltransferase